MTTRKQTLERDKFIVTEPSVIEDGMLRIPKHGQPDLNRNMSSQAPPDAQWGDTRCTHSDRGTQSPRRPMQKRLSMPATKGWWLAIKSSVASTKDVRDAPWRIWSGRVGRWGVDLEAARMTGNELSDIDDPTVDGKPQRFVCVVVQEEAAGYDACGCGIALGFGKKGGSLRVYIRR